jgi:hypothetical protein
LILSSQLPGRDNKGLKLTSKEWKMQVLNQLDTGEITQEEGEVIIHMIASTGDKKPPMKVNIILQFWNDIYPLQEIFELD